MTTEYSQSLTNISINLLKESVKNESIPARCYHENQFDIQIHQTNERDHKIAKQVTLDQIVQSGVLVSCINIVFESLSYLTSEALQDQVIYSSESYDIRK